MENQQEQNDRGGGIWTQAERLWWYFFLVESRRKRHKEEKIEVKWQFYDNIINKLSLISLRSDKNQFRSLWWPKNSACNCLVFTWEKWNWTWLPLVLCYEHSTCAVFVVVAIFVFLLHSLSSHFWMSLCFNDTITLSKYKIKFLSFVMIILISFFGECSENSDSLITHRNAADNLSIYLYWNFFQSFVKFSMASNKSNNQVNTQ